MSEMREPAMQGSQSLDISVKVYPAQDNNSKNLLANVSVTVGGCFAIRGVRVMNSEKGAFVSMPQRRNAQGEYKDICFPTTKEMRQALNNAVMDAYNKVIEKGQPAMENRSPYCRTSSRFPRKRSLPRRAWKSPWTRAHGDASGKAMSNRRDAYFQSRRYEIPFRPG